MIIRSCREDEREEAIDLINYVFRTSDNCKETMEEEFPLLLGAGNVDHIIIAKQNNKVISAACYYINDIIMPGTSLKSASIGAVCTAKEFRGQGIASKLLDYIDKQLKKQNVLFQMISGNRGLYTSRGASSSGKSMKFLIDKQETTNKYKLEKYKESNQEQLINLYNLEAVRYYRSYDEFVLFQKGATCNWGPYEFKVLCVKDQDDIEGYILVEINIETKSAKINEFAGNRSALVQVLAELYKHLDVKELTLSCPWNDPIIPLLMDFSIRYEIVTQPGLTKILDYLGIMEGLDSYFAQFLTNEEISSLSFEQEEDNYIIKYKDEKLVLNSIHDVNLLVFGGADFNLEKLCTSNNEIYKLLERVFPLPFIWMNNMNYI